MVDQKISNAQVAVGETFAGINDEIVALKKGKSVDGTYFLDPNSASASTDPNQFYGMPPNSFPEQTPSLPSVHTPSVRPIQVTGSTSPSDQTDHMTGQTGTMVQNSSSPTPLATIPSSAAPS